MGKIWCIRPKVIKYNSLAANCDTMQQCSFEGQHRRQKKREIIKAIKICQKVDDRQHELEWLYGQGNQNVRKMKL